MLGYYFTCLYTRYLLWFYSLNNWSYGFKSLLNCGGFTDYDKKVIIFSEQAISRMEFHNIRSLILHEIAHALVPDGKPHCKEWVRKCRDIGGNGKIYCPDFCIEDDYRWKKSCSNCGYTQLCQHKSNVWCKKCGKYIQYKPV